MVDVLKEEINSNQGIRLMSMHQSFMVESFGGQMPYFKAQRKNAKRWAAIETASTLKKRSDIPEEERNSRIKSVLSFNGVRDYDHIYYKLYKEFKS